MQVSSVSASFKHGITTESSIVSAPRAVSSCDSVLDSDTTANLISYFPATVRKICCPSLHITHGRDRQDFPQIPEKNPDPAPQRKVILCPNSDSVWSPTSGQHDLASAY